MEGIRESDTFQTKRLGKFSEDSEVCRETGKKKRKYSSKSCNLLLKETETRLKALNIMKQRLKDEEQQGDMGDPVLLAMKQEVRVLGNALSMIASDPYYETIPMKYLQGMSDTDASTVLHCEVSTVWRNRGRLLMMLCIYLYGNME